MLHTAGYGRDGEAMEQALYHGALSGISLDGERFFYDNPLASRGSHPRWVWHKCPCCPANIARLVASLGSYVYSTAAGALAIHLYARNRASASIDGVPVAIGQQTDFPWDGKIEVRIDPERAHEFELRLRIPGWCRSAALSVNGEDVALGPAPDRGYVGLRRVSQAGNLASLPPSLPAYRLPAPP